MFSPHVLAGWFCPVLPKKLLERFQENLVGGWGIGQRAADLDIGVFAFLLMLRHLVENSGICRWYEL